MRFRATFTPQAWQRDYQIDVDPEGETSWDCTEHVDSLGLRPVLVEALARPDSEWLDKNDEFKSDPAAPAWVREWSGPFTIFITRDRFHHA